MMTIGNLLLQLDKELNKAGISDARFDLLEIFSLVLNKSPSTLRLSRELEIDNEQEFKIRKLCKRYADGEPLAYITGRAFFWNEEYKTGPGVLIPRPDTEILVEQALNSIKCKCPVIYDLCTGTGCVGISLYNSLKRQGKNPVMFLVDKYEDALKYARINLSQACNSSSIKILKEDILSEELSFDIRPDCIVSNPPYITAADMEQLDISVKDHEPHTALYGMREDGLLFYERLADLASEYLNPGGSILVEHGYDQADSVKALFEDRGLINVSAYKDYGGIVRVTSAEKPV